MRKERKKREVALFDVRLSSYTMLEIVYIYISKVVKPDEASPSGIHNKCSGLLVQVNRKPIKVGTLRGREREAVSLLPRTISAKSL